MATSINETKNIISEKTVTFTSARVTNIVKNDTELTGKRELLDGVDSVSERFSLADLLTTKMVQTAIDELEAFNGSTVDLSTLSVEDLVHAVIHEALKV